MGEDLISNKSVKTIQWGKNSLFNNQTCTYNEFGPLPHTSQTISSKQIKYLSVRAKTVKLFEGSTGINVQDLKLGDGF